MGAVIVPISCGHKLFSMDSPSPAQRYPPGLVASDEVRVLTAVCNIQPQCISSKSVK